MLYADQGIESYLQDHSDYFKGDFLLAGLFIGDVKYGESGAAMDRYAEIYSKLYKQRILQALTSLEPRRFMGFRSSNIRRTPVSIEDMSVKVRYLGPWMREPDQLVVDLRDKNSRNALEGAISDLWKHVRVLMRFVDNAAVHPRVASLLPWDAYCQNIGALRGIAQSQHANVIFNVFARTWEMTDKDTKMLTDAVAGNGNNGISFPLPWSKSIKDDKTANAWAIYHYRQILNKHIAVILIPSGGCAGKRSG